jgi:hypothetical protein
MDDAVNTVNKLGAFWSPDLGDYASGRIPGDEIQCALCERAPCQCPQFGTPEYFALVSKRHGLADDGNG